jgi:hypothetical protein
VKDLRARKMMGSLYFVNIVQDDREIRIRLTIRNNNRISSSDSLIGYSFREVDSQEDRILVETWSVGSFEEDLLVVIS